MHLGTRDCSIQLSSETSGIAPADLPPNVLEAIHQTAIRAAHQAGYVNAGTVEFLVDPKTNEFWFMEVNTRLQVGVAYGYRNSDRHRYHSPADFLRPQAAGSKYRKKESTWSAKPSRCALTRKTPKIISCPKAENASKSTSPRAGRKSASTESFTRATKYRRTMIHRW